MPKGAVFFHRDMRDHWIWKKKPFSPGQAWTDLILIANHKAKKVPFKDGVTEISRGELIRSERDLAFEWGWTKSSVHRFLNLLKSDSMIVIKSDQKANRISICNYDKWQELRTTNEPVADQSWTSSGPVADLNNNVKECKECKEELEGIGIPSCPPSSDGEPPDTGKPDRTPHKKIIALYHEILPELPRVQENLWTGSASETHLRTRWRESEKRQDLEFWKRLFRYIRDSPFLMGDGASRDGKPPFMADLRWIVNKSNFIKICEGRYAKR